MERFCAFVSHYACFQEQTADYIPYVYVTLCYMKVRFGQLKTKMRSDYRMIMVRKMWKVRPVSRSSPEEVRIKLKLIIMRGYLQDRRLQCRSSRPEVFCKKFHKIDRKTPVPQSLFNKIVDLRLATLLKERLWRRCFCKIFKNSFFHRKLLVA